MRGQGKAHTRTYVSPVLTQHVQYSFRSPKTALSNQIPRTPSREHLEAGNQHRAAQEALFHPTRWLRAFECRGCSSPEPLHQPRVYLKQALLEPLTHKGHHYKALPRPYELVYIRRREGPVYVALDIDSVAFRPDFHINHVV